MGNEVFKKRYHVSINSVNINKKLGLFGLLSFLQDIATLDGEASGFGFEDMIREQSFWVLVRQKIKMDKFPKWNDEVEIHTWSRAPEGLYGYRDFEIFCQGEKIGDCSTVWMILDGKTRTVKRTDYLADRVNFRKNYKLDYTAAKVKLGEDFEHAHSLKVRNSDLDLNMHVNNTKYSQWILDAIPIELHQSAKLKEYEINFLSETHLGEEIDIFSSKGQDSSPQEVSYKGVRKSDGKTVFAANILAQL